MYSKQIAVQMRRRKTSEMKMKRHRGKKKNFKSHAFCILHVTKGAYGIVKSPWNHFFAYLRCTRDTQDDQCPAERSIRCISFFAFTQFSLLPLRFLLRLKTKCHCFADIPNILLRLRIPSAHWHPFYLQNKENIWCAVSTMNNGKITTKLCKCHPFINDMDSLLFASSSLGSSLKPFRIVFFFLSVGNNKIV